MKLFLASLFLIFNVELVYCSDYTAIDNRSATVPRNLNTVGEITNYLTQNLTTPVEKTRAIYYWMAHNIRYDLSKMNSGKTYDNTQEIVDEVLRNRKGVCQHYSELFHACCESAGVESFVISGYTDQPGETGKLSHAWNAVLIDGKYYDIDVTWAAGHITNGKYIYEFDDHYFLVSPALFIKSHIPYDPIWQFLNNPVTHRDFQKSDFTKLSKSSDFNYQDSIRVQSGLSLQEKTKRENIRIRKSGITNNQIRIQLAFNQQIIDSEKLNSAVDMFNKGVTDYNIYIQNKNKQFENKAVTREQLVGFLTISRQQVESAEKILNFLNPENQEIKRKMSGMRTSIKKMKSDLDKEDKFIKKYFNT